MEEQATKSMGPMVRLPTLVISFIHEALQQHGDLIKAFAVSAGSLFSLFVTTNNNKNGLVKMC